MIIDYNYLENENQVLVKAQSRKDEKYLLQKAIFTYRDKTDRRLSGIIKINDLIINF